MMTLSSGEEYYEDAPARTFRVTFAEPRYVESVDEQGVRKMQSWEDVPANTVNIHDSGALMLLTMRARLPYITRCFAAGEWLDFTAAPPSLAEIRKMRVIAEREAAINAMLMRDAESTKQ